MKELSLSHDIHYDNPWKVLLYDMLQTFAEETSDEIVPVNAIIENIYETLIQRRRDEQFGRGVILNTMHSAKGTEYNHVLLCGDWQKTNNSEKIEEERRVFYVGMTRARHTLAILNRIDSQNPFITELVGQCFISRRATGSQISKQIEPRRYILLGLDDVFLDYASYTLPLILFIKLLPPFSRITN